MKRSILVILAAAAMMLVALAACASSSEPVPPSATSPAPSSLPSPAPPPSPTPTDNGGKQYRKAPDFKANDSEGRLIKLSDYIGRKHVVLVINRGFGWTFCRRHMAQLSQDYQEFMDRNAEIIAVGPEDMEEFAQYWHENQMPFPGIPDPEHTLAELYGQIDDPLKFGRNPVMVVIDIEGQIRFEHHGEGAGDIVENQRILELLDYLNKE